LGVIWLAVLLAVVGGLVWPSSSHAKAFEDGYTRI
jgi:hypothetical protein